MAATTTQLGLVTPTQGDLSGTWGNTVNNGITEYTNIAIAGTTTLNGDSAVTLVNTTGDASATNIVSTSAQYAIVRITGTTTVGKIVTFGSAGSAPYSKTYLVDNAGSYAVTFKAYGQTGVSIAAGEKTLVFYNGTDIVKVSGTVATAGGSNTQVQYNSSGALAGSANLTFDGTSMTLGGNPTLTAGTANGVTYLNGSKVLTSGSALTFDGTNLGIGTSSPSAKIEAVAGTGAQAIAVFRTGDATAANNAGGGFNATSSATAGSRNARMWLDADGGNFAGGDYFFIDKVGNNGIVELIQASNAAMTFQTNATERMRLDASGNLGIGTSSPSYKLDVQQSGTAVARIGTTNGSGSPGSALILQGSVASKNWLIGSSYYATSGGLEFTPSTTNGGTTFTTPSMTLDSSGNLGIGTSSPTANNGGKVTQIQNTLAGGTSADNQELIVKSSNRNAFIYITAKNTSASSVFLGDGDSGTVGAIQYDHTSNFMEFDVNGAERARISAAGGFGVGTTADPGAGAIYATGNITAYYSSDIKFKENVRDIPDALATVNAIGGKLFDWKDDYIESKGGADGYFVQKADFGVVAQDVQKVFPIAVRTREDGSLAVDYEKLGALAFAALVELTKRVEALEAK
jgi:hypothetical protein